MLLETEEALFDLAAATANVTLDHEYVYLTKVQKFTLGAAAVGTDVTIAYTNAPAAGDVGFVAPNKLYFGTATTAGQMFTVRGYRRGDAPAVV